MRHQRGLQQLTDICAGVLEVCERVMAGLRRRDDFGCERVTGGTKKCCKK